jgi:aldehyde:ferredoxin oxidoreductase
VCHVGCGHDSRIDVSKHLIKVVSDVNGGILKQLSSDSEVLVMRGGCSRMGIDAID